MMKKVILFIFVILAIPYSSFPSVSFLGDAKPIGAGKIELYGFQFLSDQGLQEDTSVYVVSSQGPGISIKYGLTENSDILITYVNDVISESFSLGAIKYNTPILMTGAKQLSGGTSSIALKRSLLSTRDNSILDTSLVLSYEHSSYVIEYETTFWVMPPVTRKETIGYSRSAASLGLIISRQVGFVEPYVVACAKYFYLDETDRTDAVNAYGSYLGIGIKSDIFGLFSLFFEHGTENQRWEEGKDKFYGTKIDKCEDSFSVFLFGIGLKL